MKTRATASDLFEAGWLPPRAAASHLGVELAELERMAKRGHIRRKSLAPGVYLYDVEGQVNA